MPVRYNKVNDTPVTSLTSTAGMQTNILQNFYDKVDTKDIPMIRLSGAKSFVDYFRQVVDDSSDYSATITTLNDLDPTTMRYDVIKNFAIVFMSPMSHDTVGDDDTPMMASVGEAQIYPNTLKPMINDLFTMRDEDGVFRLYRVTNVTYGEDERHAGYTLSYDCLEREFVYEGSTLQGCVEKNYVFKYEHVGTQYRTIFQEDEANFFESAFGIYREFRDWFFDHFFLRSINTFVLTYDPIVEEDRPFYGPNRVSPTTIKDRNLWANRDLYDRNVVEFINRNQIFTDTEKPNRMVSPSNYLAVERKLYDATLFDALEKQNHKVFTKHYFDAVPFPYSGSRANPVLFDKVELVAGRILNTGCLALYPPGFVESCLMSPDETEAYKTRTYTSPYEFIAEMVRLYINGRSNKLLIDRIQFLLDNDRFHDSLFVEEHPEYAFYVFPVVGFMIQKVLGVISTTMLEVDPDIAKVEE